MASVPAAQPRQRACRQRARIWRAARAALRVCKSSSRRRVRCRFPRQPSRMRSLRAGFCRSPPRDDDKALRRRRNAEFDRRHGRRQASRAQCRDSAARARIGSRAGGRCGPAGVGLDRSRCVARRRGFGPCATSRRFGGDRRRSPAGRGTRAGARNQSAPRQRGHDRRIRHAGRVRASK